MTRTERPPNPLALALTLAATIAAIALVLLWQHPQLFLYVVAVFVATLALALGAAAFTFREQRDFWRGEAERQEAEYEDELQRLHDALSEAQIEAGVILPLPSLRIVQQRDGEHDRLPMSREEWDAVEAETVVHDAWLERLITQADPFEDGAS